MAFLGFISASECRGWPDASPFLPTFSFYEQHQSAAINATPDAIINTVKALDMQEDPLIRRLLALRSLPATLAGGAAPAARFGFDSFTPLCHNSHELSLGLAGRFWQPTLGGHRLETAEQFCQYADAEAAKLVLRFKVIEDPRGRLFLRTETFIYCPTPRVKAKFAVYWLMIRPFSGWIRQRTLNLVSHKLAATAQGRH